MIGLEAEARRPESRKRINRTAEISATAAVQTGLNGNGSGSSSGRRRKLGMTIAANRRQRDDSNDGSNGVGASSVLFVGSGWEYRSRVLCMLRDVRTIRT